MYFAISYYYSKVFDLGLIEFTFLGFEIEFVFSKMFHHLSNVFMMSIKISVEYENVIKVYEDMSLRDFNMEDIIHHCLEGSRGIGESEKHDKWFKKASICSEGSFEFVSIFDANVIVPPLNI